MPHANSCPNLVRETLSDARKVVEKFHESLFLQATKSAEELGVDHGVLRGVDIVKLQTCGRQTQRSNVSSADVSEYFRKSVTVPFLDHLLTELNNRFSTLHERAMTGMKLMPSEMLLNLQVDDFEYFFEDVDKDCLASENHQWSILWKGKENVPSNVVEAATKCDSDFFS